MFQLLPIVYAQSTSAVLSKNPGIKILLQKITDNIVAPILGLVFVFAFVVFVYGMYEMIVNAGDSSERAKGQKNILWGTVGMVIMLSVYGILNLIVNTLGVSNPFQ